MAKDNNICNICGANFIYKNNMWICPACDNIKPVETTQEESVLLWNASGALRRANFQDAEEIYSDCIAKYPNNSEGYWGRLLARYGIKYEDDFDGKRIPTVYAVSIESVLNDQDLFKALTLASGAKRDYYKREAVKFEQIRLEWVQKASKQPPIDIFISFKDSDMENNIARTEDSIDAQELYQHLRDEGYSVFFSRESLRDKLAEKFEPYIFNALNTARVMIIYATKKEYLESTWVKNEWLRYQKKIKNGEKEPNSLVLAYEKMSPADFPRCFSSVQCMNATKRTFYGDLDNHISKIIKKATNAAASALNTVDNNRVLPASGKRPTCAEDPQTRAAFIFLSKGLYSDAGMAFKDVLSKNSHSAEALWGDIIYRLKTSGDNKPSRVAGGKAVYDDVNNALSNTDKTKQILYIDKILNSLALNLDKAAPANFAKSLVVFDTLINLTNKDECPKYYEIIYAVAMVCQKRKIFEKAKDYYTILLNSRENLSAAYWGLLQSKLQARDDNELIKQPVLINTLSEFNNAIASERKEQIIDRYLEIKKKQLEYITQQKTEQERIKADKAKKKAAQELLEREERLRKRKKKRRIITWTTLFTLVVIAIIIACVLVVNMTMTAVEYNYTYTLKGYVVSGKEFNRAHDIVIPKDYDDDPVVAIGKYAFSNNTYLESITLPDTIKVIDTQAFYGCFNLKSITIPSSVESIGDNAFNGCTNLESVTIPTKVRDIGKNAFKDCTRLKNADIQANITAIPEGMFSGCKILKQVSLPNSLKLIKNNAFLDCKMLANIYLPNSVEVIADSVFSGCSSLANITLPEGLSGIGTCAFSGCKLMRNIVIPASVDSVGGFAFENWNNTQTIHIKGGSSAMNDWNGNFYARCNAKLCYNCKH